MAAGSRSRGDLHTGVERLGTQGTRSLLKETGVRALVRQVPTSRSAGRILPPDLEARVSKYVNPADLFEKSTLYR